MFHGPRAILDVGEPASASLPGNPSINVSHPIVLLFKHDLRVDDHPGLHRVLQSDCSVVPLYCLDPQLLFSYLRIPGGVELLHSALCSLRKSLMAMDSYLIVRIGSLPETLAQFVKETGTQTILMEAEVDIIWQEAIDRFKSIVPEVAIEEWTCQMYPSQNYCPVFKDIQKTYDLQKPLSPPSRLPSAHLNKQQDDDSQIPDIDNLKQLLMQTRQMNFQNDEFPSDRFDRCPIDLRQQWSVHLCSDQASPVRWLQRYLDVSSHAVKHPENNTLLQMILTTEDSSFPGISFSSLFALPLSLGILSPRRVACEVQEGVRRGRQSALSKAALFSSESVDFHGYLAREILRNGCKATPGSSVKRFWKWQGFLTEFAISKPKNSHPKGRVVLVHGFGASCMHWRRNVDALTDGGYTVYCPSLPGFGRTQKLYMKYSQSLWTEFLAAFISEVVREPAVLAGNSIGAFMAAQAAANHPEAIPGLVLINPAGPLTEDYTPNDDSRQADVLPWRLPPFLVDILSQLLLFYLKRSAGRILKSVYPVQQSHADQAFLDEILRASYDPNAIAIIKSVFFLTKPEPLNYLLTEKYTRPVLLLQGTLDPLNKAADRAQRLKTLCPHVDVQTIEAGHCGHDETPETVNIHLLSFLERIRHGV